MNILQYDKITDVVMGGVDKTDHPHYTDAFVMSAKYNGRPLTDVELSALEDHFVNKQAREAAAVVWKQEN